MKERWRYLAKCLDLELEERLLFFGDSPSPVKPQSQYKEARLYCYDCPVQVECLMSAVDNKERLGVWGGLTESQRRRYAIPHFKRVGQTDEAAIQVLESLRPPQAGSTRHNYYAARGLEHLPMSEPARSHSSDPIAAAVG